MESYLANEKASKKPGYLEISDDLIGLEVLSIEIEPGKGKWVYDFSVEHDENFISGNGGICCHNTDADVDGAHIRTLLHTLFWRHIKPLIQAGKLFIAVAPLYQLCKGKETRYAYSDEERDALLTRWGKDGVTVQRYKGLGEMNPEQLRETVFALNKTEGANPVINEHLQQVVVEDAHQAGHVMSVLMSSEVAPRKQWLLKKWAGEESDWGRNGDEADSKNGDEEQ
jgi:DNA gyrase subunit B